jgi:hypothetical protein
MSGQDEPFIVRVFVPPSFEGVGAVAVLQDIVSPATTLDIRYVRSLHFNDFRDFSGATVVLLLGIAYNGYTLSEAFYEEVDNPFTDFIHFCTYGDEVNGKHLTSSVTADKDPIKVLYDYLKLFPESSLLAKHTALTDKAEQIVEAINAYRTWTWEGNGTVRMLLALYHASRTYFPMMLKELSLQECVKKFAPVIKGQMEKMQNYIEYKKEMTKNYTVTVMDETCVLKVVYADEYINEVANALLADTDPSMSVIVCVGRNTKSNDMFSIRTRGINAGQVAYLINKGNGKENVANVFVDVSSNELMGSSIFKQLLPHNSAD